MLVSMDYLKRSFLIVAVMTLTALTVSAQQVALKTNLLYGGALQSPNLSLELRLAPRWSMELGGGANFFFYSTDPSSDRYKTKKISHWLVQPEGGDWACEAFNGPFFGLHGSGGAFKLGSGNIPFVLENKKGPLKEKC